LLLGLRRVGGVNDRVASAPRTSTYLRAVDGVRIVMVGTRGLPAAYGGFETAVEKIAPRLVEWGHDVRVYCRHAREKHPTYRGVTLVHLPTIKRKTLDTFAHSGLSVAHAVVRGADVCFLFNAANAPFLPLLRARRIPTAIHVDGLEWRRDKWSGWGKRYYKAAEVLAVRWADEIIADAAAIQDYYEERYGAPSVFIPYGADVVRPGASRLLELGLEPRGYHLAVARIEPENNTHLIVDAYRRANVQRPLVVVGSAPYSASYGARVVHAARGANVQLVGAVWDQGLLDELYGNCLTYVHGHSVGGTNPSLLRAMGASAYVLALDNVFNREVLGPCGDYFADAVELGFGFGNAEAPAAGPRIDQLRQDARQRVSTTYRWDDVTARYAALAERLFSTRAPSRLHARRAAEETRT
jgi:glycosyltransferase involved in cell wall biosynthesis